MLKGLIYSILSACCFGTLPIFGKLGLALGMGSTLMLQYRFMLGSLILLAWFMITNRHALRISGRCLMKTAFLGAVISPIQSTCFMRALETIPASTTSLILYFYPTMVTLLGALIYRKGVGRRVALSLVLVTGGCGMVFLDAFMREADLTGIMWASTAMIFFSVYMLLVQRMMQGERPLTFSLYVIFFCGLAFAATNGIPPLTTLGPDQLVVAVGLGIIPTVFAVTLLFMAIEAIGSAYASIFSTLEPVTTVIMAFLVLGEPLFAQQMAGAALIVAGIVLPNLVLLRRKAAVSAD